MIIRSEEIYKKANSIVKSCGTRAVSYTHLSVPHFSYLLEVLTGDNRLVSIGKNNPFLAVDMLIFDALVDLSLIHI